MDDLDFAILGGGISGLATAWFLQEHGHSVKVFEKSPRVGGCIGSDDDDGYLVERGPNSTLENNAAIGELIESVGLARQLREANPSAKRRYVLKHGELVALPASPPAFVTTPLFSPMAKLRLLAEPFIGHAKCGHRQICEESIADFVRRRLGNEFLDWAIDPFVSGVYAGDPERLSVQAATRKIYALEQEYGSLIWGAIRRTLAGRRSGPAPSGRLIGFADGMQTLPDGIAAALGSEQLQTGVDIRQLTRTDQGWRLTIDGQQPVEAKQLVLSLPTDAAAELLRPLAAHLADELQAIEYAPIASVALGFRREQVDHPLDGFGCLVPRREQLQTLGSLFSSTLFPGRAPKDHVLTTSFIGGARHPRVIEQHNDALVTQVLRDIGPFLGISGAPSFQQVTVWQRAIPQYTIGYNARLTRIRHALGQLGNIHARANWLDGISVADCINNARGFAQSVNQPDGPTPGDSTTGTPGTPS